MRRLWLILGCLVSATAAQAEDKLAFGPPDDWVKPPAEVKPAALPTSGPAVRYLRYDEQLRFGPGSQSVYTHYVAQVRSSLGLMSLGTVGLSWDPGRDKATVHALRIVRDGKPIDVLAKQTFSIIRREQNLEQIVDGRLTATLHPEDLRVGDVLEVAYTITHDEPAMAGHADFAFDLTRLSGIDALSIRANWPSDQNVAWRTGSALAKPAVVRHGAFTELSLDLKDLPELKIPYDAPRRFWPSREVEFSNFRTWAEVAGIMAPAFEKAAELAPDSPLKAEAAKIAATSSDPKERAALALKLVQEQVRYLGLLLSDGGYTPVDADKTWQRRFGECKAKATLLVALLHELGIKAEPALVNAFGDPLMDQRLPRMTAFNHVIVRAEIDGGVYWLDGTRPGDTSLDALRVPDHDFALPIRLVGSELIALKRAPGAKPDRDVALDIDATGGLEAPAPVKGEMIIRGDAAMFPSLLAANMPPDQRDRMLKMLWASYPVDVTSVTTARDAKTGETRLSMAGTAKLQWFPSTAGAVYMPPGANLGWPANFKREDGLPKDAPYVVRGYPSASAFRLSLKLPMKGEGFKLTAPDIDKEAAGQTFFRRTNLQDGVLTMEVSTRALKPEFPASEAQAAAEALSQMASQRVFLTAPFTYRPTEGDIAAWRSQEPKSAQDFIRRATKYGNAAKFAEAGVDFEKAVSLDPRSTYAYSGRGMLRLAKGDTAGAQADFDKALSFEERNGQAHMGLARMAVRDGRLDDAVAQYTRAVYAEPGNAALLLERAEALRQARDFDRAITDTDEALRLVPKYPAAHHLRMQIYAGSRDYDHALVEAKQAVADAPTDPYHLIFRGSLYAKMGRREDAERDFAASIALKPTTTAYLTRAANRPKTEVAARLADIEAAAKLDPYSRDVAFARAHVLGEAGRYEEAIRGLNSRFPVDPADDVLTQRAQLYVKAGKSALAIKDFAAMRAHAGANARALNNLCWTEATLNFALDAALADCAAALGSQPKSAALLDSKGFVLLRMGRVRESIEAYDAAIAIRPKQAASLYGRGLAKVRLGQTTEGEADLAAARTVSGEIEQEFAGYGIPPAGATAAAAPSSAQKPAGA
jgi:tetratricopeptide (TPR) repeat protein/transglutaminase-like putative cysteine protease